MDKTHHENLNLSFYTRSQWHISALLILNSIVLIIFLIHRIFNHPLLSIICTLSVIIFIWKSDILSHKNCPIEYLDFDNPDYAGHDLVIIICLIILAALFTCFTFSSIWGLLSIFLYSALLLVGSPYYNSISAKFHSITNKFLHTTNKKFTISKSTIKTKANDDVLLMTVGYILGELGLSPHDIIKSNSTYNIITKNDVHIIIDNVNEGLSVSISFDRNSLLLHINNHQEINRFHEVLSAYRHIIEYQDQ